MPRHTVHHCRTSGMVVEVRWDTLSFGEANAIGRNL